MTKRAQGEKRSPFSARLCGLAVVGLLLGLVGVARAEDGLVVVLEPKVDGTLLAEDGKRLEVAVTEALRSAGLQRVSPADLEAVVAGEADLHNCRTEDCQERIGRLLSGQSVVTEQIQVTRTAGARSLWKLSVALFNVSIGAVGAQETTLCENCTVDQAGQALGDLVKKVVLLDAAKPRGQLEVTAADAKGVDVLVDGRRLGFTPFKRQVFAGPHQITVSASGYRSHRENVVVEEGKKKVVANVKLQKGSDKQMVELRGPRPKWRVITGIAGIAAGLTLVGFGASALSVNGQCIDTPVGGMRCHDIYQTLGIGGSLTGIGAALIIGGAVLVALPGEKKVMQVGLAPTASGLVLAGSF